jgi:hypothetical protein
VPLVVLYYPIAELVLNTINSATQCSVMLPPRVQSIIHAEGVRCLGCGSIRTMSGSSSGGVRCGLPTTHPGMNQSFTQATEITPAPLDQSARVIRSNTAQEARNSSRRPVPPRISRTCQANPALGQRMLGAGPHIPKAGPALHHAPYFGQANQRIGQEPRGDSGQRADDRELG